MVKSWLHFDRGASRILYGFRLLMLLPIWFLSTVGVSNAASFTASIDPDVLTLGQSATLSLTFSGVNPSEPPLAPAVPRLQIRYTGQSSQFSFNNGAASSTLTYTYNVFPTQEGTFTLPAMSVSIGGQTLSSQPIRLKVVKPGAPRAADINSGAEQVFLKLVLPEKEMYLGEIIPAQFELYVRGDVRSVGNFQLSALPADGFIVGKIQQGSRRVVAIGNAQYNVFTLPFTLKAVKTGSFKFGPATASVVVELPGRNGRRNPLFDDFGMPDPFGAWSGVRKQVALATEPIDINALPLPSENVPPTFTGAVGSFAMAASVGPTNVAAGDPITVKVAISGKGAVDAINLPDQPGWDKFKTYPPTSRVDITDQLGLEGTKSFEQVVVPQSADIRQLPPLEFSYFDPQRKAYRTLTHPAVALVVRPSGPVTVPLTAGAGQGAKEAPPPVRDIVHIKPRLGALAQIAPPLLRQRWFLGLQFAPLLGWFAVLAWRKRNEMLANNPRLRRRRQVAQLVREGCDQLRNLAQANNSDEFFATVFRLLQEQIGERLDLPASSITEAVVEERLRPRNVPEELLNELQDLFHMCNLARYAPVKSSQELAALVPRIEMALGRVRDLDR